MVKDSAFAGMDHWAPSGAAIDLEVNRDTGELRILGYAVIADAGKAIHYPSAKAQVDGGAVMGFGHALFEETIYQDGQFQNGDPFQYRLPVMKDIPENFLFLDAGERRRAGALRFQRHGANFDRDRRARPSAMPCMMRSACASGRCRSRRKKFSGRWEKYEHQIGQRLMAVGRAPCLPVLGQPQGVAPTQKTRWQIRMIGSLELFQPTTVQEASQALAELATRPKSMLAALSCCCCCATGYCNRKC